MTELRSWRVPATWVSRIMRVLKWILPMAGMVATWVIGMTYGWFESRASRKEVGASVAEAMVVAKVAQANAFHASSVADGHTTELTALWGHVVAMRAELKVLRGYSRTDVHTRLDYIERAQNWYALRYEEALRANRLDPAGAAKRALLADWRPDR